MLAACSESKYDIDQLVPEEYHKILYVNNSGKQEVTLYDRMLTTCIHFRLSSREAIPV